MYYPVKNYDMQVYWKNLHTKKKEVRRKIYRKSVLEMKIKYAFTRKESEELCEILG
jgi:hypothetical protein